MNQKRLESYIPLRELMRHNHEERVHSYLKKLNEEEAEKIRASKTTKVIEENTRRSGELPQKNTKVLTVKTEDRLQMDHS
jgi:hypothetical protein